MEPQEQGGWEEENLAELFHDTYERLSPAYGYETRQDTRVFDANSKNGKLMIAVCKFIQESFISNQIAAAEERVIKDILNECRKDIDFAAENSLVASTHGIAKCYTLLERINKEHI